MVPQKVFWTKGVGTHKENKNARDAASREAGVGKLNLVTVSSILPPGIQEIGLDEFIKLVQPGEIVFSIHGVCESNVPGQKVCAGMGRARPWDKSHTGYVTELFEEPGVQEEDIQKRVETMALQLFADENGVEGFTAEDVWKKGKTTYEVGGIKVEIDSIIASGVCNHDGDYTCAMVMAVFVL
jgi:arginine decarboxylase